MELLASPSPAAMPTLADAFVLVSWWKPLILLIPFIPWGWLVSRVFDKHAARFNLPRSQWGAAHLVAGTVALLAALSLPMKTELAFWVGFGIMTVILAADVAVFMLVTNKDERVPEAFRLRLDFSKMNEARDVKKAAKLAGKAELGVRGPDKTLVTVPQTNTPEFDTRVAAENVYLRALAARASQVDFAPGAKDGAYQVSFLVDGVRVPAVLIDPVHTKDGPPPPPPGIMPGAEAIKVMDFWRGAAKLEVADRRKKQSGDVFVDRGEQRAKTRITSIGTQAGMRVTMLFNPEQAVRRKAADMGLFERQAADLKALVEDGKGVVLIGTPPDMGRTTTLYSLVKMHDAYTKNVQTLEVDLQDAIEGVRQNKFEPTADGADFGTTVRSILRRDPDVVGIAEMPDAATAKEIAKVDSERSRIYVAFKADSAMAAIQTYVKLVGDPEQSSKTLHGAVSQRLVRKLCTNCRVAYQPSADMLKKLGLPADKVKQLFKKGGQVMMKNKPEVCPACGGVGFIGQEGVFEIWTIGEAERALIKAGDWNGLRVELRRRNLVTVQQAALRKALDGATSVEEMLRVTTDAEQPRPAAVKPVPAPQA